MVPQIQCIVVASNDCYYLLNFILNTEYECCTKVYRSRYTNKTASINILILFN